MYLVRLVTMTDYSTDQGRLVEAQKLWARIEQLGPSLLYSARMEVQVKAEIQCALQEAYEAGWNAVLSGERT